METLPEEIKVEEELAKLILPWANEQLATPRIARNVAMVFTLPAVQGDECPQTKSTRQEMPVPSWTAQG